MREEKREREKDGREGGKRKSKSAGEELKRERIGVNRKVGTIKTQW